MHLIVYRDGSTNQPQPRRKSKPGKPAMDQIFDMQAGRVAVEEGVLDYDNRAARYDFQQRMLPLDFAANDVSLGMSYVPASAGAKESYRIEAGATDLNLARGTGSKTEEQVHGHVQATLDLMRDGAWLQRLLVSARGSDGKEQVLEVSGRFDDFAHPRWQAKMNGVLDVRLLEPITGYPFAPEGLARVNLAADGAGGGFRIDGHVHVDNGAWVCGDIKARGVIVDARVHADRARLLIDNVVARLPHGGELDGTVDLTHWQPAAENEPRLVPAALRVTRGVRPGAIGGQTTVGAADQTIPVDGKVTAQLKNVPLDAVLDIVSQPPFQRLGIDALLNGPAEATWSKGDNDTVVVTTNLALSPSGHAVSGDGTSPRAEAPANGAIDATYRQHDGSVDVRMLELHLPESTFEASGRLGAYPMNSATALAVNFHSRNLNEFDTVLRGLGLVRAGRAGAAALPARLGGQADFTGTWAGSLLRPLIAGTLKATQLSLEMPAAANDPAKQPRFVNFDSAEATGSYSDTRIAIDHGTFQRGAERLALSGTLDAASGPAGGGGFPPFRQNAGERVGHGSAGASADARFDRDSELHVKVQAVQVGVDDLQPFVSARLPFTGALDAQFEMNGPLGEPGGSGWVELRGGTLFGQAVTRIHAQGSLAKKVLKLNAVNASAAGGSLTGTGSYDFASRRIEARAQVAGMELAQLAWIQRNGISTSGKLGISISGSGTFDDPRFEAHAAVAGLVVNGEQLGVMEAVARTANRAVDYDVKTQLAGAELNLHGRTDLHGDHATDNRLEFSKFDVGALLKMAHVESLTAESAMNGTITLSGPLARPEQLRGEAHLGQLEMTLAGVHLKGEGGAHATLADGRIHMDPMHVTGEDTDVHAFGHGDGERRPTARPGGQRHHQPEAGGDTRSGPDGERNDDVRSGGARAAAESRIARAASSSRTAHCRWKTCPTG